MGSSIREEPQPIPFTVLGGYLGSGKTTLLNYILRHPDGRRLAVIVNDFGSVNIDASLIEGSDGETVNLANGCVCCSISGGFSEALAALSEREPPPEHVVIEASGVADPAKVGYFGSQPPYRLDGVAVVVDAETIRQRAADKYVGDTVRRQLASADIIVLNKTDLVDPDQQAELRTWLHQQVPGARYISTCYGELPLAMLLGPRGDGIPSLGPHDHDHIHDHGDEYASWSLASDTPVRETTFRAAVASWPETVLRAKGVLFLQNEPSRRYVFQLVGRRWSLTPDRAWGRDLPHSAVVVIGLTGRLDGDALLRTCLAD